MLRVLVEADDRKAERLERFLAGQPGVTFRRTTARAATEAELAQWRPHLLVLDPDAAEPLAPFIPEAGAHALSIAFLPPADRDRVPAILNHAPIGVLPPAYDRGDVTSLLAAARSEAELPEPLARRAARPGVEVFALASAAAAALIGFSLPGAPALLQGDRQAGYVLAAALSLVALVVLLSARRPWAAALQAALVGLLTLAPTEA